MSRLSLRALAAAGALLLPLVWLATLGVDPVLQRTNYLRVIAGTVAAAAAWISILGRGGAPTWKSCVGGGVAGSLLLSLASLLAPGLGEAARSGWLTSGVVGGAMVALVLFALRGSVTPAREGSKAGAER